MTEKFRPNLHFSPKLGWMNDPNGMIRFEGIWHLFYQHDPHSTVHGPMHWGHATSSDLLRWTEQPIALYPDALGTCFSGSAIESEDGIKLFYTAHSLTNDGEDYQVQCLVHANDQVTSFATDAANPVVPNPGLIAFRDPKVIWHEASQKWVMLVTEGQSVGFYGSTDLRAWAHLSSFGETHGRHSEGPWECPDLVPLMSPGGETVWVLIIGLNPGGYALGSGTQYFLGTFDGTQFTNANPAQTELWLDYGRDYYAAQTFFERGGTKTPTAIAWVSNWLYARQTKTNAFRGVMSLPRELRLVDTPDGLRVAASAPASVEAGFEGLGAQGTYRLEREVELASGKQMAIHLFGESHPQFIVHRHDDNRGSIRTIRQAMDDMHSFEHDYAVDFPWPAGGILDLILFVDRGLVELSAADGLVWITNLFFPADPEAAVVLRSMEAIDA